MSGDLCEERYFPRGYYWHSSACRNRAKGTVTVIGDAPVSRRVCGVHARKYATRRAFIYRPDDEPTP